MAAKRKTRTRLKPASTKPPSATAKTTARPARTPLTYSSLLLVLSAGILVRIVVFSQMGYLNNDDHLEVIEYVARNWLPPPADQFNQSYHPPLYYFVAATLLRIGGLPTVHALSLLLSIATLVLIADLLRRLPWIHDQTRPWCLALAAFHSQFVMFGLFVSNDALAIFFGVLIFYQCRRLQEEALLGQFCLLGTWLGLALLTKATFLVFTIPLMLFVWMAGRRSSLTYRQLFSGLSLFALIAGVLGCYKYAENFALFGNPFVSNLDFWNWVNLQQPTWIGFQSLVDFNFLKLVRYPIISPFTVHSYPLMLYGSFWYALIPESTFISNLILPLNRLGSIIYLLALCPMILMFVGAARIITAALHLGSGTTPGPFGDDRDRVVYDGNVLLILFLNFLLILAAGWRYDAWSIFQGRLVFPSYFALLLAFNAGMEAIAGQRHWAHVVKLLMGSLIALFLAYMLVDVWLAILYPGNPLGTNHMPYEVDMSVR